MSEIIHSQDTSTTEAPVTQVGNTEAVVVPSSVSTWKNWQKVLFRIAFIFFVAISIPNSVEWYKIVLNIDWTNLHYRDLYDIARFGSGINLFGSTIFGNTLNGYANWVITLGIAIVGGLVWTAIARQTKKDPQNYNILYYWLRVIVRYRAATGIIGFGFTKLLPVQMPYPSLGLLNSNLGDFTAQKIYWMSVGIDPWYQIFGGVVEVLAGLLLFFRGTTTIGAALLFGALADIVYVNFAYDGGVHVYSSYFVILSAFLIIYDIPKLYNLIILEKFTIPVNIYPSFAENWKKYTRVALKVGVIYLFIVHLFYLQYINFKYDPYKQPSTAGIKQLRGNYAVTEFRKNGELIPYNPLDPNRWSEATFEKWTTLTFRTNKANPLDLSNGGGDPQRDINRTFELTGNGGGQRVFHYYADTIDKVLYLQDKYKANPDRRNRASGVGGDGGTERNLNKTPEETKPQQAGVDNWISAEAWKHIGNEVDFIDPKAASTRRARELAEKPKDEKRNRFVVKYDTKDGSRVILSGIDENKDSIYVVLDRIQKDYILAPDPLKAGKYE